MNICVQLAQLFRALGSLRSWAELEILSSARYRLEDLLTLLRFNLNRVHYFPARTLEKSFPCTAQPPSLQLL